MNDPKQDLAVRGKYTSASNALADSLCHGRHLASRDIPDTASEDASHGTAIHNALAIQDPKGLDVDQEDMFDSCNAICDKVCTQFFGATEPTKGVQCIREKRFWIRWADGNAHSGQVDVAFRVGTRALIIEFKTLTGQIAESPKNLQLRDQVCLYDAEMPLLSEVGCAVIQPLVTHTPEICVYQKADIVRAREEMYVRVAASNKPDAKRTAGEVQCKFCKAKNLCVEYGRFSGALVTPVDSPVAQSLINTPVAAWTPEMRSLFLERKPIAQKWLDGCTDEMKRLLKENPEAIPGYEMGKGRNISTIINAQSVFEAFSKQGGTLDDFMKCIDVGKTKLKEAVKTATKLKGQKLDAAVDGIIGQNIITKQSEPSIVKK